MAKDNGNGANKTMLQERASEARLQALQMKGSANVFWDLIKDLGKFQGTANDREAAAIVEAAFDNLKAAHKKWQEAIKST